MATTTDEAVARVMAKADEYATDLRYEPGDLLAEADWVETTGAGRARAALEAEVRALVAVANQAYASWLIGDPIAPELAAAVEAWIGFDPAHLAAPVAEKTSS